MSYFIQHNVIQVGWNEIGDLNKCQTREDIRAIVELEGLKTQDANLKIGLLYNIRFQMNIGDYCILPYEDFFYLAVIIGDYTYTDDHMLQTRSVTFLNQGQPFGRKEDLPEVLQRSLRSRLALANLTDHIELFLSFMKEKASETDPSVKEELERLLPQSLEIIKNSLDSEEEQLRLLAALGVVLYSK